MTLLLLACTPVPPPDRAPDRAIILVMDGVSGQDIFREGSSRFSKGTIWGLAPELRRELLPFAVQVSLAENSASTLTGPAHWDLITGRHVGLGQFGSDLGPGAYVSAWPTIFNAAQDAGSSEGQTWIISNGKLLTQLSHSLAPGSQDPALLYPDGDVDDATLLDQALELLQTERPKMLLVNAHRVDHYGHYERRQSYVGALRDIDRGFLAIWRWINEDPDYAGRTVLAIVSDHGRHLDSVDKGWQSHGDACGGCRSIPLLLAGPGIPDGEVWAEPWDLIDVAPTLAALTGWKLPYAQGLPMAGAEGSQSRTGEAEATADSFVVFLTELDRRTELVDEKGRISSEGSREARGPRQAGELLCWRELGQGGAWDPWTPHCAHHDGPSWIPVDFPASEVHPFWSPAMVSLGEAVQVAWVDNPKVEVSASDNIQLRLHQWSPAEGWSEIFPAITQQFYPDHPSIVRRGEQTVVAWVSSKNVEQGRYNRYITVQWGQDGTWTGSETLRSPALDRLESPVLRSDAEMLAFLGMSGSDTSVYLSRWSGSGWEKAEKLSEGTVLPQVEPLWTGQELLWVEEGAELCRWSGEGSPQCSALRAPYVEQLFLRSDEVWGIVAREAGAWERAKILP